MKQYKNTLEIRDNRHSCAKLKTYHFSGEENNKNTHSDYIGALKRLNKIEDMITSLFDEIANFQERAPSTYNGDGELALEYDFWSAEQTLYGAISEARSNLETALKQRQNR